MPLNRLIAVGAGLYAVLSVTDWVLTYSLLNLHPAAVEANPVAAACLERHGWDGLALYKVGSVLMFLGAVVLLTRRRPALAAAVVTTGCVVLLGVTLYTHVLIREVRFVLSDADTIASLGNP
jgi:hypothetical protein